MLDVPLLGWIATLGAILALIALDCTRLCFGHERLPGSCNVPACRPERPARSAGPSSGRSHLLGLRVQAGRWS
jgi:hypothetical protein